MKPKPRKLEQDDLLRPRLTDMIDLRHELATLADLIDWEFFEREWAWFFPSSAGVAAGKPKKAAITAVMRKLIVLANALLKAGRKWTPKPA